MKMKLTKTTKNTTKFKISWHVQQPKYVLAFVNIDQTAWVNDNSLAFTHKTYSDFNKGSNDH